MELSDKETIMRIVYYGASAEFLLTVMALFVGVTALGLWRRPILWGGVRALEGMGNAVGRLAAWAGLLMVVQQIMIIFLQRIFRVAEIEISPFGFAFAKQLSWWGEELKLYNAIVVALCLAYTFVQGGHVRVDLIYSGVSYRAKRVVDAVGAVLFMIPVSILIWNFAWFFLWRSLIVPRPSSSDTLERLVLKARAMRWNVETIGFSPNGFDAYFLFKVLLAAMTAMIFVQAWAVLWRSLAEIAEGPAAAGRHMDPDNPAAAEATEQPA